MQNGEHGDLFTDQLTLLFQPVPPGAEEEPGMFESNGTRLAQVLCDGNFKLVGKENADTERKAAAGAKRVTDAPLAGMLGSGGGSRELNADRGVLDLIRNESEFHGHVAIRDALSQLNCDDMFIYTAKSRPAAETEAEKPAEDDDPDADPFADRRFRAEMVPARIMLTDGLDLERILCTGNVHLARKDEAGKLQQAFGERAEYIVADKRIVLTGTPAKRPMMTAEGGMMRGDRVVVDTATGNMRVSGRTRLERDGKAKLP